MPRVEANERVRADRLDARDARAAHDAARKHLAPGQRSLPLLERERLFVAAVRDRLDRGAGDGKRRDAGDASDNGGLADRVAVAARVTALRRVHDEVDAAAADELDDRLALVDTLDRDVRQLECGRGSGGCDELEAVGCKCTRDSEDSNLVGIADAQERAAAGGKLAAGGALGPGESGREVGAARHHLPGRAHLGAEHRVGAGEPHERKHRRLHVMAGAGFALRRELEVGDCRARREPAGGVDEVDPGRLGGVGNGARRPRVHLEHVDLAARDRELHVQQPDHAERRAEARGSAHGSRASPTARAARMTSRPEWIPASSTCSMTAAT